MIVVKARAGRLDPAQFIAERPRKQVLPDRRECREACGMPDGLDEEVRQAADRAVVFPIGIDPAPPPTCRMPA
ncbi:hypothetical protein [Burkholderia aenigmatica]|uniref:hypothetical protein n=1 Tax=Burkholderia aenigmatica TaxID=2015348 RepID=UPI002650338B|nr:hypothetical protein [Burkholderia aenigmatica]MDN7873808.1 hypothetical protein [Burkholderia aenigmatica]